MLAGALIAAAIALTPGTSESFESMKALPDDWRLVEYTQQVSKASIRRGRAADGKQFVRLTAPSVNHTRLFVPASVEPGATYRFSMMVRATAPNPVPAVLAVDQVEATTTPDIPGDGEWHEASLFVRPGSASQITLIMSLGRFGQTVAGTADFDVLRLDKVDDVPAGAQVVDLPGASAAVAQPPTPPAKPPSKAVFPLTALLLALIAGCWSAMRRGDHVR